MDYVAINQLFLQAGDDQKEEACAFLFNTYREIVFNRINRMMWDHPDPAVDAEDLMQETFIQAFKERHQVREPEKLLGWLLAIAKNLTLNAIRKAKKQARTIGESEAHYETSHTGTGVEQAEVEEDMVRQLLLLLQGKDREIVELMLEGLRLKEIAEAIGSTPEAVQKRWERIRKWLTPIARNLEALVNCLPEEKDRWVMERYLDGQPLSEIAEAIGISDSKVEETVKRVIKQWKKAARQNSTDPVSAMVKND